MIADRVTDTGFTLTELCATVAILTVLGSVAAPSMTSLLESHQAGAALRAVEASLRLTRSHAIQRNAIVTICPLANDQECGRQWELGYHIFVDSNDNHALDESETLIAEHRPQDLPGTIHWRAFRNRRYLQFTPQGFTRYQNGNFTFCHHSDPTQHRQLVLNRTGRIRYAQDHDGDGYRENSQGDPIDCS